MMNTPRAEWLPETLMKMNASHRARAWGTSMRLRGGDRHVNVAQVFQPVGFAILGRGKLEGLPHKSQCLPCGHCGRSKALLLACCIDTMLKKADQLLGGCGAKKDVDTEANIV